MDALKGGDPGAFFDVTVPWNFSPQFIRDNPALLEDARKRYVSLDFPAIVRLCECFLEVSFTERLGEIATPTCILVGEADLLKGPEYAQDPAGWNSECRAAHPAQCGHASCWGEPRNSAPSFLGSS
jgi:hypothetical protein